MVMASTIIPIVMVYVTESYKLQGERLMKIFGDTIILVLCYLLFCFAIMKPELAFEVGYSAIGILGIYIVSILLIVLLGTLKVIRKKVFLYCAKRSLRKQMNYNKKQHADSRTTRILKLKEA